MHENIAPAGIKERFVNLFARFSGFAKILVHFAKNKPMSFISTLLLLTNAIGAMFFYAYFLFELFFVPSHSTIAPLLLVFGLSGGLFFVLALCVGFLASLFCVLICRLDPIRIGIFVAIIALVLMLVFANDKVASISGYGNFITKKIFIDPRLKGSFECEEILYCKESENFIALGNVRVLSALGDKYFIALEAKDGSNKRFKIAKVFVLNSLMD